MNYFDLPDQTFTKTAPAFDKSPNINKAAERIAGVALRRFILPLGGPVDLELIEKEIKEAFVEEVNALSDD